MSRRWLVTVTVSLGFGLGVVVTTTGMIVRDRYKAPARQDLTVAPVPIPPDLDTGQHVFSLAHRGRKFAIVELTPRDAIDSVQLLDTEGGRRAVRVSADGDLFPGRIMVDVCEGDLLSPSCTIMDNDADGIPDRRMDWPTRTCYHLDDIQWGRKKGSETQPATAPSKVRLSP